MPVDNFAQIKSILDFSKPDMFYWVQLMRRASDDPKDETSALYHGNMHSRSLKSYDIYNAKEFEKFKPEIISLCEKENCRAYIRLNRRNDGDVANEMYDHIRKCMKNGTYKRPSALLSSAKGKTNSEPKATKSWIVDCDEADLPNLDFIRETIENCKSEFKNKIMYVINTKHGIHFITHPFNKRQYELAFEAKGIECPKIHEDNPTLMYAP